MSVDYSSDGGALSSLFVFLAAFLGILLILCLALYVYSAIVENKILRKANHKNPWAGWVPVYNLWALAEIAGYPGWMGLLVIFANVVPIVGNIACIVVLILLYNKLSKSFGKDAGFTVGLFFLAPIFMGILAFGKTEYVGPDGDANANPERKENPTVHTVDAKETTNE